jgi:hypothetical protein
MHDGGVSFVGVGCLDVCIVWFCLVNSSKQSLLRRLAYICSVAALACAVTWVPTVDLPAVLHCQAWAGPVPPDGVVHPRDRVSL